MHLADFTPADSLGQPSNSQHSPMYPCADSCIPTVKLPRVLKAQDCRGDLEGTDNPQVP